MKVLFVASEIFPFVKTGGLGDVVGALPPELVRQDVDTRVLLPAYPEILKHVRDVSEIKTMPGPFFAKKTMRFLAGTLPDGLRAFFLDIEGFYNRSNPYIDKNGKDWPDNHLRFGALCHAAATIHSWNPDWAPDVIHGHDWHCGLIPAYLRKQDRKPATITTIHNMAYQGIFPKKVMAEIALPQETFTMDGLEYYGQISFLKAGLSYSNAITTVSPHYAREIQQKEYGCGMEDLLKNRAGDVHGILNGIDPEIWNPETDVLITPYHGRTLKALKDKNANRASLLSEKNLNVRKQRPVFGVVSRLVEQKGLDLLLEAAPDILCQGAGLVVLGAGDPKLEKGYTALAKKWPQQVSVQIGYDENMAHRIIAGCDSVVIPSRFEPCGLVQLYALRYGTLPVVRRTGGLADTVTDAKQNLATGFVFEQAGVPDLAYAMQRACNTFSQKALWSKMQKTAMAQDYGWARAATEYKSLYKKLAA